MKNSGILIVSAALALSSCGGTTAGDAYDHASAAADMADQLQRELREAVNRIDELESKISELEYADRDLENRIDDVESRVQY